MKRFLLLLALAVVGLGPPGEATGQSAGGKPILVRAVDLATGKEIPPIGAEDQADAARIMNYLRSLRQPPYTLGFGNIRSESNPGYGRNPLISNRPGNPDSTGLAPGRPSVLDQRRITQPSPTPTPTPTPTPAPVVVPAAPRPLTVPVNPAIEPKFDQLRQILLPEPSAAPAVQPLGRATPTPRSRFGYDETLTKSAPKGVLMRVGIDNTTLQSAAAAPRLLDRIRKDK